MEVGSGCGFLQLFIIIVSKKLPYIFVKRINDILSSAGFRLAECARSINFYTGPNFGLTFHQFQVSTDELQIDYNRYASSSYAKNGNLSNF